MDIGASYEISYKDDSFVNEDTGQEFKYRVVEHVAPANGGTQGPAPANQPKTQFGIGGQIPMSPSAMPPTQKDEDIAALALAKLQTVAAGDRAALFHVLKASALAWRDFKKWQKEGNIETGKRSMKDEMEDEIPGWGDK